VQSPAALYYHPDAYVERTTPSKSGGPVGLMGRQVAGQQFLDAFLTHGSWDSLTAVVPSREMAEPLVRRCHEHPSSRSAVRRLHLVPEAEYPQLTTANVLHFPVPPDERFAWLRHSPTPPPIALCGVTHTLASPQAVAALCSLLTAPFESCDALICTSHAVHAMVRAVLDDYGNYLAERFGGTPRIRPRLEVIPLGVNPNKFRPATADERKSSRAKLSIHDDEVMVLCVGRLSHHAKAHPYPLFHAAEVAARRTGRKVHLVFAGWAAHPAVAEAYRDGAKRFAPSVRTSFVDGQQAAIRESVWHAADVFASLPDNIQETFGLVILEAMASGLPVLASDWNGYRDLVADGETGFRVPTYSLKEAASGATQRLLFGQTNYDHFLAECVQTFTVDLDVAAERMIQLVLASFAWSHVIRRYESLWRELAREVPMVSPRHFGPARYPELAHTYAAYPTRWLEGATILERIEGVEPPNRPLTNLAEQRRIADVQPVLSTRSSATLDEWTSHFVADGASREMATATLAWLLKYGVLRVAGHLE
jgi:glycosyltransferase involved in cell wall biosynthesis